MATVEHLVSKHLELLDLERRAEEAAHTTLLSSFTVEELEGQGLAMARLEIADIRPGLNGRLLVRLCKRGQQRQQQGPSASAAAGAATAASATRRGAAAGAFCQLPRHRFRSGDLVDIYPATAGPYLRKTRQQQQKEEEEEEETEEGHKQRSADHTIATGVLYRLRPSCIVVAFGEEEEEDEQTGNTGRMFSFERTASDGTDGKQKEKKLRVGETYTVAIGYCSFPIEQQTQALQRLKTYPKDGVARRVIDFCFGSENQAAPQQDPFTLTEETQQQQPQAQAPAAAAPEEAVAATAGEDTGNQGHPAAPDDEGGRGPAAADGGGSGVSVAPDDRGGRGSAAVEDGGGGGLAAADEGGRGEPVAAAEVVVGKTSAGGTANEFSSEKVKWMDSNLVPAQQQAVLLALRSPDVALIHGPPGTGKTTTVVELLLQLVLRGNKVLACAPSNVAVDNMLGKLLKAAAAALGRAAYGSYAAAAAAHPHQRAYEGTSAAEGAAAAGNRADTTSREGKRGARSGGSSVPDSAARIGEKEAGILWHLLQRGCVRLGHPARVDPKLFVCRLDHRLEEATSTLTLKEAQEQLESWTRKRRMLRQGARETDGSSRHRGKKAATRRTSTTLEEQRASSIIGDLREVLRKGKDAALREVLRNATVIFATCTGSYNKIIRDYAELRQPLPPFDVVIIDEAAQALESECWVPLLQARRAVLAGDHQQLGPVVKCAEAERGGLKFTLFERLMTRYVPEAKSNFSQLLDTQFRMHATIMRWSSIQFYQDKLRAHPSVATRLLVRQRKQPASREEVSLSGSTEKREDAAAAAAEASRKEEAAEGGRGAAAAAMAGGEVQMHSFPPLLWIDTAGVEWLEEDETEDEIPAKSEAAKNAAGFRSRSNLGEAGVVLKYVRTLVHEYEIHPEDICVITPYTKQVHLLRRLLQKEDEEQQNAGEDAAAQRRRSPTSHRCLDAASDSFTGDEAAAGEEEIAAAAAGGAAARDAPAGGAAAGKDAEAAEAGDAEEGEESAAARATGPAAEKQTASGGAGDAAPEKRTAPAAAGEAGTREEVATAGTGAAEAGKGTAAVAAGEAGAGEEAATGGADGAEAGDAGAGEGAATAGADGSRAEKRTATAVAGETEAGEETETATADEAGTGEETATADEARAGEETATATAGEAERRKEGATAAAAGGAGAEKNAAPAAAGVTACSKADTTAGKEEHATEVAATGKGGGAVAAARGGDVSKVAAAAPAAPRRSQKVVASAVACRRAKNTRKKLERKAGSAVEAGEQQDCPAATPSLASIAVNTVDGFQGKEAEVIVICLVRSNRRKQIGFLVEPRRLNVAVTRAKRHLVVIGNSETMTGPSAWLPAAGKDPASPALAADPRSASPAGGQTETPAAENPPTAADTTSRTNSSDVSCDSAGATAAVATTADEAATTAGTSVAPTATPVAAPGDAIATALSSKEGQEKDAAAEAEEDASAATTSAAAGRMVLSSLFEYALAEGEVRCVLEYASLADRPELPENPFDSATRAAVDGSSKPWQQQTQPAGDRNKVQAAAGKVTQSHHGQRAARQQKQQAAAATEKAGARSTATSGNTAAIATEEGGARNTVSYSKVLLTSTSLQKQPDNAAAPTKYNILRQHYRELLSQLCTQRKQQQELLQAVSSHQEATSLASEPSFSLAFDSTLSVFERKVLHEVAQELGMQYQLKAEGGERRPVVSVVADKFPTAAQQQKERRRPQQALQQEQQEKQTRQREEQQQKVAQRQPASETAVGATPGSSDDGQQKRDDSFSNRESVGHHMKEGSNRQPPTKTEVEAAGEGEDEEEKEKENEEVKEEEDDEDKEEDEEDKEEEKRALAAGDRSTRMSRAPAGNGWRMGIAGAGRKAVKKQKKLQGTAAGAAVASAEEDVDALIRAAVEEDSRCSYGRQARKAASSSSSSATTEARQACKNSAQLLGRTCPFCRRRFCCTHAMPEIHGCGAAASAHARAAFIKKCRNQQAAEQQARSTGGTRGGLLPTTPAPGSGAAVRSSSWHRRKLQERLRAKIEEAQKRRTVQRKDST